MNKLVCFTLQMHSEDAQEAWASGSKARHLEIHLSLCSKETRTKILLPLITISRKTSGILCLEHLKPDIMFIFRSNSIPSCKRYVLCVINSHLHILFPYFFLPLYNSYIMILSFHMNNDKPLSLGSFDQSGLRNIRDC